MQHFIHCFNASPLQVAAGVISGLMEAGGDFVAVDMPMANRLTDHILAAVAQAEADRISERTKDALAAANARGQRLGTNNLTSEGTLVRGSAAGVAIIRDRKAAAYGEVAPLVSELKGSRLEPSHNSFTAERHGRNDAFSTGVEPDVSLTFTRCLSYTRAQRTPREGRIPSWS